MASYFCEDAEGMQGKINSHWGAGGLGMVQGIQSINASHSEYIGVQKLLHRLLQAVKQITSHCSCKLDADLSARRNIN